MVDTHRELRIRSLSKVCRGVAVLKGVTLTISTGVYGVLGPAGAGKSTLLRILATLQKPDEGSIVLGEIDVQAHKDEIRETLVYVPQDFGRCPRLSAEKLLDYLAVLKGAPELLILDEPTAGFDAAERTRFLTLLRERGRDGIVILATHDVEDVSDACTKLAIIDEGRILLEAEPQRAVKDLCGRVWSRVISKEALPRVEREYAVISTRLVDGNPVVRVYSHTPPAVGFEQVDPNLEDVYFSALAGLDRGSYLACSGGLEVERLQ